MAEGCNVLSARVHLATYPYDENQREVRVPACGALEVENLTDDVNDVTCVECMDWALNSGALEEFPKAWRGKGTYAEGGR